MSYDSGSAVVNLKISSSGVDAASFLTPSPSLIPFAGGRVHWDGVQGEPGGGVLPGGGRQGWWVDAGDGQGVQFTHNLLLDSRPRRLGDGRLEPEVLPQMVHSGRRGKFRISIRFFSDLAWMETLGWSLPKSSKANDSISFPLGSVC